MTPFFGEILLPNFSRLYVYDRFQMKTSDQEKSFIIKTSEPKTMAQQFVLIVDLVRFVCTEETQLQPIMHADRQSLNPFCLSGKRKYGRLAKSEQHVNQKLFETTSANLKILKGKK